MSGDQQESVEKAPPVRLGEILSHRLRERRQRGHDLGGELTLSYLLSAAAMFITSRRTASPRSVRPRSAT